MLGVARHEPHVESAVLPVGGTALLFTDGLVEDRTILLDDNLEKLRVSRGRGGRRRGRGVRQPRSCRSSARRRTTSR